MYKAYKFRLYPNDNQNILDAGFNKICELLKCKAKLLAKYYYQVDTYYPSSKICSHYDNKTEITNDLNAKIVAIQMIEI